MKNFNKLVLVALASVTCGCATQTGLTYVTVPPGAYVSSIQNGQQHGIAPLRLVYNWDRRYVVNGCLQTSGVTAKWVSGASVSSPNIITICNGPGSENTFTLQRPATAEGLEKDMQFGLQVQNSVQSNSNAAGLNQILMYNLIMNQ